MRWPALFSKGHKLWVSQVALVIKNLLANAEDVRDAGSIPGLERFPWRRAWQPTPVGSCLENPMDRGAWQATVHRVAEGRTQLKQLNTWPHRA